MFALSWLITWFGHVLSDFRHVVRLYDFFLACHPLMPIYFAAVVSFLLFAQLVFSLRELIPPFLKKGKGRHKGFLIEQLNIYKYIINLLLSITD